MNITLIKEAHERTPQHRQQHNRPPRMFSEWSRGTGRSPSPDAAASPEQSPKERLEEILCSAECHAERSRRLVAFRAAAFHGLSPEAERIRRELLELDAVEIAKAPLVASMAENTLAGTPAPTIGMEADMNTTENWRRSV